MSQEMNVLHCSSCKTYQVSIVKKAKKWQCKICNLKQPLKQVYFKGSGKDCRVFVQKLNFGREQECQENIGFDVGHNVIGNYVSDYPEPKKMKVAENKWTKYLGTSAREELANNFVVLDEENDSYENIDNSHCANNKYLVSNSLSVGFANMDNNPSNGKEFKLDSDYDNEEEYGNNVTEKRLRKVPYKDDNNKENEICNKKNTDFKCTKNIFDDNEDFDLAFDF